MKEIRSTIIQTDEDNASELVLVGTPILFDQPTTITTNSGSFIEVIERGALNEVNLNDTRLLYNHQLDKVPLAKTPKTMQLTIGNDGLHMRAELPNTEEARSIHEAVAREDLSGMSFGFTLDEDGQTWEKRSDGSLLRTIHKINKIYEISIVPFPAYENTTVSVEARSKVQHIEQEAKAEKDLKITLNKILFKGDI